MMDWFEWNGVRCTEYGIHVLEQPPITVPAERATHTNVPGRPGSLTTLEGEDVYDDMILTATCLIADPSRISEVAAWLKGSGTVTFANREGGIQVQQMVVRDEQDIRFLAVEITTLVRRQQRRKEMRMT